MKLDRDQLEEDCAQQITDAADIKTLVQYFYDMQLAWYEDLSDIEMIEFAEEQASLDAKEYYLKEDKS